ncbi:aminotransferase-like domain-containing protein [Williamsia soli]|uniref:aminotransferase-like domain-containing protein n=1 Tax=Williamsia soli TaxID=364929 RepID=UPI001A9E1EE6|nr:PLP-dependent aminotransferase family protein [Williamsia soli]
MSLDALVREGAADSSVIMLGGGMPATELFPRAALTDAFRAAMDDPAAAALQYDWPEGRHGLREWVAARLRGRGADVDHNAVILTAGAQQGISLACQFLLRPGSRVRVSAESYPAALELFRQREVVLAVGTAPADCVYVMDGIDNPYGSASDPDARADLIREGLPLIVDEAYAELDFEGRIPRPLLADARDRVWHVGSVSKTLSPGLRTGWLVPPPHLVGRVRRAKFTTDLQSSTMSQLLVERFLATEDYDAHLVRARSLYARRASVLSTAVRRHLPEWRFLEPAGGFALFLQTDHVSEHPTADQEWLRTATHHGVAFDPGSLFQVQPGSGTLAMRLCFSAADDEHLIEGAKRLRTAWRAYLKA